MGFGVKPKPSGSARPRFLPGVPSASGKIGDDILSAIAKGGEKVEVRDLPTAAVKPAGKMDFYAESDPIFDIIFRKKTGTKTVPAVQELDDGTLKGAKQDIDIDRASAIKEAAYHENPQYRQRLAEEWAVADDATKDNIRKVLAGKYEKPPQGFETEGFSPTAAELLDVMETGRLPHKRMLEIAAVEMLNRGKKPVPASKLGAAGHPADPIEVLPPRRNAPELEGKGTKRIPRQAGFGTDDPPKTKLVDKAVERGAGEYSVERGVVRKSGQPNMQEENVRMDKGLAAQERAAETATGVNEIPDVDDHSLGRAMAGEQESLARSLAQLIGGNDPEGGIATRIVQMASGKGASPGAAGFTSAEEVFDKAMSLLDSEKTRMLLPQGALHDQMRANAIRAIKEAYPSLDVGPGSRLAGDPDFVDLDAIMGSKPMKTPAERDLEATLQEFGATRKPAYTGTLPPERLQAIDELHTAAMEKAQRYASGAAEEEDFLGVIEAISEIEKVASSLPKKQQAGFRKKYIQPFNDLLNPDAKAAESVPAVATPIKADNNPTDVKAGPSAMDGEYDLDVDDLGIKDLVRENTDPVGANTQPKFDDDDGFNLGQPQSKAAPGVSNIFEDSGGQSVVTPAPQPKLNMPPPPKGQAQPKPQAAPSGWPKGTGTWTGPDPFATPGPQAKPWTGPDPFATPAPGSKAQPSGGGKKSKSKKKKKPDPKPDPKPPGMFKKAGTFIKEHPKSSLVGGAAAAAAAYRAATAEDSRNKTAPKPGALFADGPNIIRRDPPPPPVEETPAPPPREARPIDSSMKVEDRLRRLFGIA